MTKKQKVLIFIDWFYPAYKAGGPIKSVFNIVSVLKKTCEIRIITSAYDLDGTQVDEAYNELLQKEGYEIIYLTKENQQSKTFRSLVGGFMPDLIYYNSVFSIHFTIRPLFLFKSVYRSVIAPRGMLGAGALKIKSTKKALFLFLAKHLLFDKNIIWHASTELELQEIKAVIGKNTKVLIAQNLSSPISNRNQLSASKKSGELNLVFLSRISEKKNLLFLLKAMSVNLNLKINLAIYGPIEDETYWFKCKVLMDLDNRIKYLGTVKPNEVTAVLQSYHFSVLPTKHENYGHSIAESITSLVPVLVSKNTPWVNLENDNIGCDLDLDEQEWLKYLEKLISMNQTEYSEMLVSCKAFAKKRILSESIIRENEKLFQL